MEERTSSITAGRQGRQDRAGLFLIFCSEKRMWFCPQRPDATMELVSGGERCACPKRLVLRTASCMEQEEKRGDAVMREIQWEVQYLAAPPVRKYCKKCNETMQFVCSGRFRVNAQKKTPRRLADLPVLRLRHRMERSALYPNPSGFPAARVAGRLFQKRPGTCRALCHGCRAAAEKRCRA